MKIEEIKNVCVCGGGQMGRQIALNTAIYGYEVYLTSGRAETLLKVKEWAEEYLRGRVEKGKMSLEQAEAVKGRMHYAAELEEAAKDCQLVIEAIVEDKDLKTEFFTRLSDIVSEDTIIASNSSYIVSSEFKDYVKNPSRLANLHFFNPALAMKAVEVVSGEHTSENTAQTLMDFAKATGKMPIRVNREIDGFVVNRVLRAIRDEAFYLVEEGIVSPADLDIGVEQGLKHPMGPFRLLDLTGVDLMYRSSDKRWNDTGIKPHGYEIVKEMFENKQWGRKTGKGFYDYTENR